MKEIVSSMAGTILNVVVSEGETVEAGKVVVMLESMKMEIPIESQVNGVVKEIRVSPGEFVNEGDVLIVLE
jgi:acetyl-CoA carboxylase biotin carboxyl carrier protein